MDQQEPENVSDDSVYALITGLCSALSGNVKSAESDEEAAQRQIKSLRTIAFSHLHKRSTVPNYERIQWLSENIPLGLFILGAAKKVVKDEWSYDDYVKGCKLLEKLELFFGDASELSSASNIGRMLIALGSRRPQQATTSTKPTPIYGLENLDGLACIPLRFKPVTSQFLTSDALGNEGFTPVDFLWDNFKALVERLHLPKRMDTMQTPVGRLAIEHKAESQRLPRSTSRSDEGFSSPTDVRAEFTQPFDWSNVPVSVKVPALEWESFPHRPERQHFLSTRSRALRDITLCPTKMFKVSQGELIECIKALLVGVPSQCFDEVDGEFFMTPGLFTDETPPHLVLIYCKKFRRGGMLFSKLLQLTEYYNSLTSASMNMVIQNFILDYQALLKSITVPTSLMKLTLVISPFINTLEYLVDLVESDHLGGWHLLQRLYEDALQTVEPNLIRLTSALFVDCYTTYLKFIEKWIFEGEWHQELFFKKHILQEDVFDRTSWSQSYSFDPLNAPSCLPAAVIYRCGMLFHLVRDRTSHIEAKGSPVDCRPKMKMITNKNEFAFMKQTCHHYSNTGEALRLEASQKCWKDHNVDLLMLAKETAEAECLKHYVEKNAEREKVLTQKLDNIMQMKEELARFEKNRNTEQLKHNLSELLEEDRRTYYHIEKAFLSARHRYKLIDQFINQEERLTKKSLLNSWKEKRYNLNVSRAQHFEGCISMAEYISPFPEQKMDTVDNAKKDSTYETLPSVHTCGTAYQSLVDIAPKDFLVLKASVNNSSSSSDKSSYDEASSVPVAGPSRENQMERESASTSASGSPSPGVLTGGVSVASSPLEQCRNPEPFPTTSKSIDVTGEYDIRAKSNQNLHDSSSEDNIDMEHGKSLLYFLANQSVEFPLDAQSRTLRNLLIHNLFIENDLLGHLRRMRTVFLKQDGNGARSLTKILCRNTTIYDPSEFSLHYRLRNIIIQAYPKDYNYFNLKADFLPLAFDSTDPKVFDFLSLEYACSWPLNLVLTETAIQRYCSAWEFLNSIDMTLYYLQEVFEFLRVNHTKLRGDNYKQIQSHRHTMLGFVNSLKYYCGSAVADTWADLRLDLQAEVVRSPEEIYRFHACFLKKVHTKLMLTDATKPIQECLMKALHSVMVYCLTILHVPMEHPTTGQCKHPKFRKLLHTFNNFKVMFEKFQELLAFFISKYGYVHLQILIQPED